ncbi:MAG TPA: HlyD family efflux transporter periplasmic adaptor subunit, partial [Arenimonas sp.]|nr:HlyD family efflux transporter periplasmic adaptor subunit [Arenimonas sp.]
TLLSVVDPGSMRFEGLVAAEQVAQVKAGARVGFRVNGYADQRFEGRVERVNPLANANTRQVQVLVSVDGADAPKVAGLYAEGRIEVAQRQALVLPESALQRDGDAVSVWQVKDGSLRRVAIELGERDQRSGRYEVRTGLQAGDQVLRHPVGALRDGAPVQSSDAGEPSLAQHGARG